MDLGLKILLEITNNASAFGMTLTPAYDSSDLADDMVKNQTIYYDGGISYIPGIGYILAPTYKSQDTLLTGWNVYPTTGWTVGPDATTGNQNILQTDATPGLIFQANQDDFLLFNSAGWIDIGRGCVSGTNNVDTTINIGGYSSFTGGVGTPADSTGVEQGFVALQINLPATSAPYLSYGVPDGAGGWTYSNGPVSTTYATSRDMFVGDRTVHLAWWTFTDLNVIVVYLAGEYLLLYGKNSTTVTSVSSGIINYTTNNIQLNQGLLSVWGQNGTCQIGYYPMKYATSGSFTNAPIQTGFVYQNNGICSFPKASIPDGCEIDWNVDLWSGDASQSGTQLQYTIHAYVTGVNAGLVTPVIPEVQLQIPAVIVNGSLTETFAFTEADISEIEEHQFEDRNEMMDPDGGLVGYGIHSEVYVKFANWMGNWTGAGGQHANCQYSRNLAYINDSGEVVSINPANPYLTFLTGWCGDATSIQRNDPDRSFHMVLRDKTWPLMRVSGGVSRYNDGYCYLAAMRLQLERSGVAYPYIDTTSDYGFGTCSEEFNPLGCTHYKLPIGTAQSPACSFDPNAKFWQNIMWIAGHVHEVVWADQQGVFHRAPYSLVSQGPSIATFTTADSDDINDPSKFLLMVKDLNLTTDTIDKRTVIMTVGIDPATNTRRVGWMNVDDQPGYAGYTANYHGFVDTLIVVSRQFVDPVAQQVIMQAMMQKMLLANNIFEGTYHFLSNIAVYDNYTVAEGTPLGTQGYVLNAAVPLTLIDRVGYYKYNPMGKNVLYSTMRGRWTPNN